MNLIILLFTLMSNPAGFWGFGVLGFCIVNVMMPICSQLLMAKDEKQ